MAFLGVACCRDVVRVVNPRCEMQVNPVGLSAAAPHLSWELISGERGVEQRFYRILVASSEENLDANRGDKWDSGWVRSDESVYIPYGGAPLRSRETCFWKVRVKTGKGARPGRSLRRGRWDLWMLRPGKPGGSASTGVSKGSARRGIPAWRRVISERNSTHRAKCAGRCCTSRDWGFTKRISTGSVSARRCWHRRLPITTSRCFTTCSMLQKPSVRAKTRSVWCWGTGVMSPRAIRGCAISDFRRCFCSWSWNMPTHVPQGHQRRFVACDGRRADPREQRIRR